MWGTQVLGQGGQVLGQGTQVSGQGTQELGYSMLPSTGYYEIEEKKIVKKLNQEIRTPEKVVSVN